MKDRQCSFSRLNLYKRCLWAYKTDHIDKIPRAQSEALQIGTVMHQLVADYLGRLIASAHRLGMGPGRYPERTHCPVV